MKYPLFALTLLIFISICSIGGNVGGINISDISNQKSLSQNAGQSHLPTTVVEAVALIILNMSAKDKEYVRNTKKDDLIKFHHGWVTVILNEFGLWGKNHALLKDTGKRHPDDASMVIIEAVWEELQKD